MVVASTIAAFIFLVFDTIDFDFSVFAFGIDVIVPCYQDNFISGLVLEMYVWKLEKSNRPFLFNYFTVGGFSHCSTACTCSMSSSG